MNILKFNKRTWLGAMFTFALVAVLSLTFAFKPFSKTNGAEKRTTYKFQYSGSSSLKTAVENPANWTYTPSSVSCSLGDAQPCQIEVSDTYVNPGSTPTLKSQINIVAAEDMDHNTFYVDQIADDLGTISNRAF